MIKRQNLQRMALVFACDSKYPMPLIRYKPRINKNASVSFYLAHKAHELILEYRVPENKVLRNKPKEHRIVVEEMSCHFVREA